MRELAADPPARLRVLAVRAARPGPSPPFAPAAEAAAREHDLRCARCGYGIVAAAPPSRCPLCGAGAEWVTTPSRPATRPSRLAGA
jgi:hypothetical protein